MAFQWVELDRTLYFKLNQRVQGLNAGNRINKKIEFL